MINDLKLGLKTLRYGSNLVSQAICGIVFYVLGLTMSIGSKLFGVVLGATGDVFMIIAALFPAQMLYSLSVSKLVQSSPSKKRMQTSVPTIISAFCLMGTYLLCSLINGIIIAVHPEYTGAVCAEMLIMAIYAVIIQLSIGSAYKHFWVSIVLGVATYFFVDFQFISFRRGFEILGGAAGSFWQVLVLGLILIMLGSLGQYGLTLLVYKAPMSKYAQCGSLRKEM